MPALLVSHRRPGFYLRVLAGGRGRKPGRDHQGGRWSRSDDGRRDRRAALPAAASAPRPRSGPAHPGAERRVAGVVPERCSNRTRARGTRGSTPPPERPRPGAGSAPSGSPSIDRESDQRDLDPPGGGRRRRTRNAAGPGQFVTVRMRPDADGRPAPAQLLAVRPSRRRRVPHQRQARGPRRGQRLPARDARGGRHARDRRAARSLRAQSRRRPGRARQRGRGRDAGARHAPRPRRRQRSRRPIWWLHGARNRGRAPLRRRGRRPLASLPDAHRLVCYSAPGPLDRRGRRLRRAGSPSPARSSTTRRCPSTSDLLPLWSHAVHARRRRRAGRSRGHARSDPRGGVRSERSDQPGRRRRDRPEPPHAPVGPVGPGPDVSFSPQQPHGHVGPRLRQPARAGRGVRRPREVVVSQRRVPHVRDGPAQRHRRLPAGPDRSARRRATPTSAAHVPQTDVVLDL